MKLSQLSSGIASGYVSKAVQFVSTIVLVPFLLDPEVLGIDRYGHAFTILGLVSVLGLLTIGIHTSFDRSIAKAIGGDGTRVGELIGSGTKIVTGLCVVFAVLVYALRGPLLRWTGVPVSDESIGALGWASALVVIENVLYLVRTPLLTRGDVSFVNFASTLEVGLRTISIFFAFSVWPPSIALYFAIQVAWTFARQLMLMIRLRQKFPDDLHGATRSPLALAGSSLRYSAPVFLSEGATYLIRRVPVIVASQFLGAKEAGFVAVVLNTMQSYVLQILFAVVQPLAVPLAARLDFGRLSAHRRSLIWEIEALYCACVILITSQFALWMPELIHLWLGEEFDVIVLPSQIMVAACSIEICLSIRRSVLIGQGHLAAILPVVFASAVVSLGAIVYAGYYLNSWEAIIIAASIHFVVSNLLGVNVAFSKIVLIPIDKVNSIRFLAIGPIFACAIFGALYTANASPTIILLGGALTSFVLIGLVFSTIISPLRAKRLITLIIRRRDANLFSAEAEKQ